MAKGFFSGSTFANAKAPPSMIAKCGECGLHKTCQSPKMPHTGEGRRKILIVAEAPGKEEDRRGVQLIGEAGQLLRKYLRKLGVDLDRDCWKTNSILCHPPGNETPNDKKIVACRPHLIKTVRELNPETIILLGGTAVKSMIGWVWKSDPGPVSRWVGFKIPCQDPHAWICPTYHPSFLVREAKNEVLKVVFEQHLEQAMKLSGRPPVLGDLAKQVTIIKSADEVADAIQGFIDRGRLTAVDYETDRLKPEHKDRQIVCCSLSDGKRTIAYPWYGAAIKATKRFWKSPVPKIAANMKFEDRWTRCELGVIPEGWTWDTMNTAHLLDYRKDITGLKFQAFVMLGQSSYNDHIEPYLKASSGNGRNRIREVSVDELLLYCGLDSLLEYKLARLQARLLKMELPR